MKKALALVLAAAMALSFVACGGGTSSTPPAPREAPRLPAPPPRGGRQGLLPELQARAGRGLAGPGQEVHRGDRRARHRGNRGFQATTRPP